MVPCRRSLLARLVTFREGLASDLSGIAAYGGGPPSRSAAESVGDARSVSRGSTRAAPATSGRWGLCVAGERVRARLHAPPLRRRPSVLTAEERMRCLTLAVVATLAAPLAVGCARARAGEPLASPGDPTAIAAASTALDESVAQHGPGSDRVLEAAQALLEARPDATTAGKAWLAKAEAYFAQGDDASAIAAAEAGMAARVTQPATDAAAAALVTPMPVGWPAAHADPIAESLARVWIRAMVRGGEPRAAVEAVRALANPAVESNEGGEPPSGSPPPATGVAAGQPALFPWSEWRGLLAVAASRHGRTVESLTALAAWRATLAPGDPGVAWAEVMLGEVAQTMGRTGPGGAQHAEPASQARSGSGPGVDPAWTGLDEGQRLAVEACVQRATQGSAASATLAGAPRWTERCAGSARRLGVLLPRSGKLAGLSDAHMEGIEVGLAMLSAAGAAPTVTWLDPGADEAGMTRAATAAIRAGLDTLVGPVGHDSIALAERSLDGVTLVIPGEAGGRPASGSSPASRSEGVTLLPVAETLETRVAALVQAFVAGGETRLVVLAPASSYGRRARSAVEALGKKVGLKDLKFIEYPVGTTSFVSFTESLRGADPSVAVLVLDVLPRAEAVLRQLRRDGVVAGSRGARFGSTAEGFEPARLVAARGVFEGALLAPPAFAVGDDPFARAFTARFGRAPSDQAVLAWRALQVASGVSAAVAHDGTSATPASPARSSATGGITNGAPLVGVVKGDRLVAP